MGTAAAATPPSSSVASQIPMPALTSQLDTRSQDFQANVAFHRALVEAICFAVLRQPARFQAALDSFGDHRIAMAFAVAALRAGGECTIERADGTITVWREAGRGSA